MISLSMSNYETQKHWADKVVFLLLFVIALLLARFIVSSRSSIRLSEPIKLEYGGLSVSIPTGKGWQRGSEWKYQQNAFILGGFLTIGSDTVSVLVSCRYRLIPETVATEALFEKRASAVGGVIAKTGQIEKSRTSISGGFLVIDWAHIKDPKTLFDTFFGVAQLPSKHRLDIEVYQTMGDTDLAEKIFKSVVDSLEFADARLLENGSKVVAEIKSRGLDSFLDSPSEEPALRNRDKEVFFLIKDTDGNFIGFTMEVLGSREALPRQTGDALADVVPEAQLSVLAASFYYIRNRYDHRQAALFQSDNSFNRFIWKSETHGPSGRSGAEMVMGEGGVMAVKKFGQRVEEKLCQISSAAIPDILSELLFSQMLDSSQKEVFVDIIGADSEIIPTLISRIEQPRPVVSQNQSSVAAFTEEEIVYAFKVEFLDGKGFSEQVYLDEDGQVLGRLLQQDGTYTLKRTNTENILKEFPKEGSYILQKKNEVFEQNQLLENSE